MNSMHNGGTAMLPEGLVTGRRILVVGHSFLGDALMTTPFIRALAESGPEALGILAAGHGLDVYSRLPFAHILHEQANPPSSAGSGRPGMTWPSSSRMIFPPP